MPEGPERKAEEDELFDNDGMWSRRLFDWMNGGDMTFRPSDLEINPETGRTRVHDQKQAVSKDRGQLWEQVEKRMSLNDL
ncbi:MAG: hypothetical protein A3G02_03055 [Candidatus Yanofskybacteria bacterium RIFCSPLOWO2_12_FULL_44_13b]|uniref:Uncharacterized protein n=2 Tax=Candidatus Yanofskyibacteriota TaxID=1752733 RepID=A0A1F8GZS4_9BACT|nr:MAG: hypothetical protein UW14_C0007G0018 [Candidatus Yanofskybacteria bacterium GW2011_GWA2_44_10]KKT90030.1 MAG: hypothetical protein UW90_C0008G0019 [Candidatus Yanofskybacteria bacterium GW2011_GWB1_45_11]OGN03807.1 MAG: hypothetical protein A2657_00195 [Candidatus Yanofskybacteria bacterium RIFCSPHIGHO2_01_FULL_44_110b]OGN14698.1 MAG: hypothetical protein A3C01_02035 [Candidatus Yanofskybacteria bacterium RIFCSPHIGHO2_02_FULL_44_36b]OGN18344.1 MAG: hypothetical protein A3F50_00365 [Cand